MTYMGATDADYWTDRPSLREITLIADGTFVPDWKELTTERLIKTYEEFHEYGEPAPTDLLVEMDARGLILNHE